MAPEELVELDKVAAAILDLVARLTVLEQAISSELKQVQQVSLQLSRLPCMASKTNPDCPDAIAEVHEARQRRHSMPEIELDEDSSVRAAYDAATRAVTDSAMKAAMTAVREHRSGAPAEIKGPFGLQIKGGAFVVCLLAFLVVVGFVLTHGFVWAKP
jgi:hypothetical protein